MPETGVGVRADSGRQSSVLRPEHVGRGEQWQAVRDALESVGEKGQALFLSGEPGIGKTVFLDQVAGFAARRGARVLRVTGAEAERTLAFAALHQLLWPLKAEAAVLSPAGRSVIGRALGDEGEDTAAPHTVAAAALQVLAEAARDRPLVLLADDFHWVDASSAEIFQFIRRRLSALPLVMIAAVREDALDAVDSSGAGVICLDPLGDDDARTLLHACHPELTREAGSRFLQEAAGNPLALVELPAQLDESHRTGGLPLPDHLPLSERLERMFADRITALSDPARFVLLLCALTDRDGQSARLVATAAGAAGFHRIDHELFVAERSGLVHLVDLEEGGARVGFRHPLVRSCLVRGAAVTERRRAHRAWADVLPAGDVRQVTHLAAAAFAPDESVAAALDKAARTAEGRGGDAEAADLYARAASLSTDPDARGRRLVTAICTAVRGGRLAQAARLLDEATGHSDSAYGRNALDFARALVRFHDDGDFGPAIDLVPRILASLTEADETPLRTHGLILLMLAASITSNRPAWDALAPWLDDADGVVRLAHDAWHDPVRNARGGAARLARIMDGLTAAQQARHAWLLAWAAVALDAVGDHTEAWHRIAESQSYCVAMSLDGATAYDDYLRGSWDRCVERCRLGAASARARGYAYIERVYRYKEGYVLAARGLQDEVDLLVSELRPWAAARNHAFILRRICGMQAMCALGRGENESAYAYACAVTPPGALADAPPEFQLALLDLVEAAARTGRTDEARRHVAAAHEAGVDEISPHHAFLLAAAAAFASSDAETDAACRAACAVPGAERRPFVLARVQLWHGAWLRRRGRRPEARRQLEAALGHFTALGAKPWADRAAGELRVAGGADGLSLSAHQAPTALTAQESRIADLVAEGLTNREIARRMDLSPRTVGSHLYRIYPKLGVTSRAGVARALH